MSLYKDREYRLFSRTDKGEADEETKWAGDRVLISQARAGVEDALAQLRQEKIRSITDGYKGQCPDSLLERLFTRGCHALDLLLGGADEFDAAGWRDAVLRIQGGLRGECEAWVWDRDYVILALHNNSSAEKSLLEKYVARIEAVAKRFRRMCPDILDDLEQEGHITFYGNVIPTYDPARGSTLWEYASRVVWRRMRDVCLSWATARGRTVTLDRGWEGDDAPDVPALQIADPQGDAGNFVDQEALYERVVQFLNENAAVAESNDGAKWLAVFTLREHEDYGWREIVSALAECKLVGWITLHKHHLLPPSVPRNWEAICALFKIPPPTLNEEGVKKWFKRRGRRLLDSGLLRPVKL